MIKTSYILILPILFVSCITSCNGDTTTDLGGDANVTITQTSPIEVDESDFTEQTPIFLEMQLKPIDYVNWVNNEGENFFIKNKKIGVFNYSLKHLPIPYLICNELKKNTISQQEIDSLYDDYAGMEYYELRISIDDFNDETAKYGISDMGLYQQRIVYMSFAMQDDIKAMIDDEREVDCKLYHFERTYGVAPYAKFIMGFSKEDMGNDVAERTIVFEDNLFNKGLIKFNWQSAQLENVPKIEVYDKEA